MTGEEQLDEYVLNDNGKVWQGTYKEPKGYQWFFGQFESVVLPSIMMLLDRSSIPHHDRADPVKMTRTISAIVSMRTYSFHRHARTGVYVCVIYMNILKDYKIGPRV